MKSILRATTATAAIALATGAFAASHTSGEITMMSWGGAYGESQTEAYIKPYNAQGGVQVKMVDADNPATPIKAQVESGNVTVDIVDIEEPDALRLCDEGLLEEIDVSEFPAGEDGTSAEEDFLESSYGDCFVPTIVFSHIYGFDKSKFEEGNMPSTLADFFDTEKFPGKRGLRKSASPNLEMALVADGVDPAEVYNVLSTPEGVDQAFAKLDTIKGDAVFWEAGAQPPQLLADGEVTMTTAYNGRIFNAMADEGQPFETVWDGQALYYDVLAIPKGAPNKEAALEFLKFATDTQRLADQAKYISYGPARASSAPKVGTFKDTDIEMAPHMPTNPDNLTTAITVDPEFLADNQVQLEERFQTWLNQ